MSELQDRMAAARARAESIRAQIAELRDKKTNGRLPSATRETLPALGPMLKMRRNLKGHFGKVYSMHWAGDAQRIVSVSQDGKLIVWDAMSTNKEHAIPLRSSWVMTCAFETQNNILVACGGLDNLCSIYTLNQAQVMRATKELAAHDGYLSCCRFVDEGSILSSSGDATCIHWDIESGKPRHVFEGHDGDVMSVAIRQAAHQNIFISGSCDATCKMWDLRTPDVVHTFVGHESDINSVDIFPDGYAFGTGSDDSTCRLFDMRCLGELNEFGNEKTVCGVTSVAFSNSGRLLFGGYDDYNVYAWDVAASSSTPAYSMDGHENRVSSLGVNNTGQALCTGSWDTTLRLWA